MLDCRLFLSRQLRDKANRSTLMVLCLQHTKWQRNQCAGAGEYLQSSARYANRFNMIPAPAKLFDDCVEMNDRTLRLRLVAQCFSHNVITGQDAKRLVTIDLILGFVCLYQTVNADSPDIRGVEALDISRGHGFGSDCGFIFR